MEQPIKQKSWPRRHPILTGLGIFIIFIFIIAGSSNNSSKTNTVLPDTQSPQPSTDTSSGKALEVVKVDTKVVEKNIVWWKYSYILTIKNNTSKDKVVNANITWYDKEGFAVNTKNEYALEVPANTEKTFSGYDLIDIKVAPSIATVQAEI